MAHFILVTVWEPDAPEEPDLPVLVNADNLDAINPLMDADGAVLSWSGSDDVSYVREAPGQIARQIASAHLDNGDYPGLSLTVARFLEQEGQR